MPIKFNRIFRHCALSLASIALASLLSACGGSKSPSHGQNNDYSDLEPYRPSAEYASVLKRCVDDQSGRQCRLDTLPLIGMETMSPGVEDILGRLVVSHDWMGTRMEEILNALPEEMLSIFRGVTAIVIDDDIRPAYYTSATGAIYLDPAYLWLSVEEANTINPKQDYRSGFSDPLAFRSVYRYVKDGQRAYSVGDFRNPEARELAAIVPMVANLLLHELAHANDYFPPHTLDDLNTRATILEAARANQNNWISTRLSNSEPLQSSLLYSVAAVMYRGRQPGINELEASTEDVGLDFEIDSASDDYAYTSQFEDVAMLFEEIMMLYFFGVDRDFAFTSPPDDDSSCNSFIIGWGVRNRIGESDVKMRAQYVVDQIFPNTVANNFFETLRTPEALENGTGWCASLVPAANTENRRNKPGYQPALDQGDLQLPYL
ncbi:hypothetical protein TDB9533_00230 [Thalassocella blandensis]|nr:hypothetical protein TDB9533_00230 [Thalassocella blandensis]